MAFALSAMEKGKFMTHTKPRKKAYSYQPVEHKKGEKNRSGVTLTIVFYGTCDSYQKNQARLPGRVYDAIEGEEYVHKVVLDGVASSGLDLDRRWIDEKPPNNLTGTIFGAGLDQIVTNAMAIITRTPTKGGLEEQAEEVRSRGPVSRVNLVGHSRGAVACCQVSWAMWNLEDYRSIEVNCWLLDPVPGPFGNAVEKNATLPPNVKDAQVWISEHEFSIWFEPLIPVVVDATVTNLEVDIIPGNHVNGGVDADVEPFFVDPEGKTTRLKIEKELFPLMWHMAYNFLEAHGTAFKGDVEVPQYSPTDILDIYEQVIDRWPAFSNQQSMIPVSTKYIYGHDTRRCKYAIIDNYNGSTVNETQLAKAPHLQDFFLNHRHPKMGSRPMIVNKHHIELLTAAHISYQRPSISVEGVAIGESKSNGGESKFDDGEQTSPVSQPPPLGLAGAAIAAALGVFKGNEASQSIENWYYYKRMGASPRNSPQSSPIKDSMRLSPSRSSPSRSSPFRAIPIMDMRRSSPPLMDFPITNSPGVLEDAKKLDVDAAEVDASGHGRNTQPKGERKDAGSEEVGPREGVDASADDAQPEGQPKDNGSEEMGPREGIDGEGVKGSEVVGSEGKHNDSDVSGRGNENIDETADGARNGNMDSSKGSE